MLASTKYDPGQLAQHCFYPCLWSSQEFCKSSLLHKALYPKFVGHFESLEIMSKFECVMWLTDRATRIPRVTMQEDGDLSKSRKRQVAYANMWQ